MTMDAAKRPLVSVVIVNWNGKHLLPECLDSVFDQNLKDVEVVVVDNGSQDGSVQFVRSRYPAATLVSLPVNAGFAGGSNAGIRAAAGKYIALLNNDTRTDRQWLANLVEAAETGPPAGMWASKILSYDRPGQIDSVGLLLYRDGLARGRGRLEQDEGQYDQQGEALFPSGCAGLYSRAMLDEIGLFDEDFFAYADDVDLGLRARIAGWKCIYVPTARVYHRYSASSSSYSPFKAFLVERNRIWVLFKYYPVELILVSPFFTLKRLALQLYGAMTGQGASGKFTSEHSLFTGVTILIKAWAAAIGSSCAMVKQRRKFGSLRRIGRREFYHLLSIYGISASELALKD